METIRDLIEAYLRGRIGFEGKQVYWALAGPLPTGSGAGGAPVAQSSGVAALSLLPSGFLISISRAELARRDYDDQDTPTHDHAGTPRDQDAPAFGEQLRELLRLAGSARRSRVS